MRSREVLLVLACGILGCREDAVANRAIADILAGNGHILHTSGIASGWPSPAYDQETGLPIHDQGCMRSPDDDAYNAAVRRWVAAAALPPKGSMKGRMLDRAVIETVLASGRDLELGAIARAPDGRVVSLRGDEGEPKGLGFALLSVSGGPFIAGFSEQVFTEEATPRLRFAWAPDGSVLLAVDYPASQYAKGAAYVQIDPACRCILQVLDAKPWGGPPVRRVDLPPGTVHLREPVFTGVDEVEAAKSRLADLGTVFARCLKQERDANVGPSRYDATVRMSLAIAPGGEVPTVSFGPSKVPASTLECFRRVTEGRLFPPQKSHAARIELDVEVHRE